MSDYKISVIVPVYNAEKYLRKCIDSLVSQTYGDYEVILVDDGSPDRCGVICDEYSGKYPFIRVLHQENGGQSKARNSAARIAEGEFLAFVDSDDHVEPDYLEYLAGMQKKYDADVSIGGFVYLYESDQDTVRRPASTEESFVVMDAVTALDRMNYTQGFGATVWAKLFRKELILDHPFPEGQIYEDLAVMYKIICDCKVVVFGKRKIYYWVQHQGSTMRSQFSEKQMAALDATRAQIEYVGKNRPGSMASAKARHEAKIVELMAAALFSENSRMNYRRLKNESMYYGEVMSDPKVKRSVKLRMAAIRAGYVPAKAAFTIHEKAKRIKFGK